MSRLLRALGFGDGGERPSARRDTPKVRRLRETMRWRGYDLSEYTDEQIATVSARFPNDISEEGETTEDGRRALAEALARGEFAAPEREEPALQRGAARAAAPGASPPAGSYRSTLGMPTLPERLRHIIGIHAWRPREGGDAVQCAGCGQVRNAPAPFGPAADPLDPLNPPASPPEPATPFDRSPPEERDREPERVGQRPDRLERPDRLGRPERPESPWQFFLGLPWWSKLLAIFILVQVIGFIVSVIGGGGG